MPLKKVYQCICGISTMQDVRTMSCMYKFTSCITKGGGGSLTFAPTIILLFCSQQKLKMWSLRKTSSSFSQAREEGQIIDSQTQSLSIIITFLTAMLCMYTLTITFLGIKCTIRYGSLHVEALAKSNLSIL